MNQNEPTAALRRIPVYLGELKQTTLKSHRILRIPIVGKGLYEF